MTKHTAETNSMATPASTSTQENARPSWDPAVSLIDPQTLMRIKSLELRAKAIVEGFWTGLHRSPYHGFSVEFTEYRQYTVGDDPRYLDWKLYARSDRLYVKRFEDETNLRCHVLLDHSKSMQFGSLGYTKAQYAATLAATLGYFLNTQRDAVGLVTFDEEIRELIPSRYRPGHLRRLMVAIEKEAKGKATDLVSPLRRVADIVTKRGLLILISDLLSPLEGLSTHLSYLRSRGHEVVLFHILDPAELTLDFDAPSMFFDLESGRDLYIDPQQVRQQYLEKLKAHNQAVQTICDDCGIDYHQLNTDQPLELAMFDFLCARMHLKRQVMRRTAMRTSTGGA